MKTKLLTICLLLFTSQVFAEECKGKYWDNCYGTYTWDNGNKYVGEWKNNNKHGLGTYTYYANGDKYVGKFKNDHMHGQGTYTYASGDKYVGALKDAKKHGLGTYTFVNGDKEVGQWKNDKYVGK